jgi:hypothetical protein
MSRRCTDGRCQVVGVWVMVGIIVGSKLLVLQNIKVQRRGQPASRFLRDPCIEMTKVNTANERVKSDITY